MKPPSSRDIPSTGPEKKDEERETREAVIKDADKTEVRDRERIHGDGSDLGLDKV